VTPWYRPTARQGDAQSNGSSGEREESECQQTLAPNGPPAAGALALTICSPALSYGFQRG
jgi:hypothetical protein